MVLDIIFLMVGAYGFYLGFSRGIIRTVFTILSYTFGLIAAFKFSPPMTNMLKDIFSNDNPLMFIAGFLLSFILTMVILRMISRTLEGILESVNINIINQLAGGALLSAIMILIYSWLLQFADTSRIITNAVKQESITYEYVQEYPAYVGVAFQALKPTFEEFWDHSVDFMDQVQDMGEGTLERSEGETEFFEVDEEEEPQ